MLNRISGAYYWFTQKLNLPNDENYRVNYSFFQVANLELDFEYKLSI